MAEHFLTVEEAAALWRVTPTTIRRWCKRGMIEAVQFTPRCWRIPIVIDPEAPHGVQGQEEAVRAVMQR